MRRRICYAARTRRCTARRGRGATASKSRTFNTSPGHRKVALRGYAGALASTDAGHLDLGRARRIELIFHLVLTAWSATRVAVQLVVERLLADAQRLRRARLVVLQPAESREDVLLLDLPQRQPVRQLEIGALPASRRELAGQVPRFDDLGAAEDDGALERVAQLADVSRPGIVREQLHCLGRNSVQLLARVPAEPVDEVLDQDRDVLAAL